ncbi:MAG: NTP transferase domain-containing protein [Bacteroidaceae bacterium]|nr:NTP transferase domain-containing protein [Bacteroidaceae bacterium]
MKFAIIAAGEGSRLAQEGITTPKPLIEIQGVPMIERLVKIFAQNGADSICIIINSQQPETHKFLLWLQKDYPIEIVLKDTPSSMHSLHMLSPYLKGEKFCLTTVDTLFRENEFKEYIRQFNNCEESGLMAVTDYIDDEKPLYVECDERLRITAFRDAPGSDVKYISGGIYGLPPQALDILEKCIEEGQQRMRNFQRRLVAEGVVLNACPFGKIIDIDHAEDIAKAEIFLSE